MVAASGYISGTNGAFVQGLVVNYAQQQGAGYLDDPVAEGKLVEGTPLHAALHGLVACAGAAASSQSCGSGAAGAAASSVLTGLFSEASPDETEQQREAKRNLIVSLVTGLAANSPQLDATTANSAAGAAVDNNWLATQQLVQLKKEYEEADGVIEKAQVLGKWGYISSKQDVLTQFGLGKGLVQSGWGDVEGMAQFLADPMAGLEGLKALVTDAAAQNQMLDGMATKLKSQIDTMANALEQGGDENAIALGEEMGNLIWTVGSFVTGVGGIAKGGVALAKTGIKVGTQQLEKMSYAGKLEIAAKAQDAKPALQWTSGEGAYSAKTDGSYGPVATTVDGRPVENAGGYSLDPKGLGQTGGAVTSGTTLDLFSATRGKDLSKLTNQQVGDLGEDISKVFLRDNNHTDIFAVQNRSGNGIDIVSRTPDGRLAFTEEKTSRTGNVGDSL
ncbi:hypothetical protein TRP66_07675 [Pseudomonas sp. JDS28PS106]|uniref:hypothetical protein n=1 Tax=Pseudomonas sp. JDS28PS106 TaxID=2497235 RepID=UPI002FD6538B